MRAHFHLAKLLALACLVPLLVASCNKNESHPAASSPTIRRLTEAQYRNVIADVFGDDIQVSGRFDRPERIDGLLETGTVAMGMTASAYERYDQLARSIAAQVVDARNRNVLIPCQPANAKAADRACAEKFYRHVGRYLYRRPLTDKEVSVRTEIAAATSGKAADFYAGLAAGLSSLLVTPSFLYVSDQLEPNPAGGVRLDGYSRAARLSFFLWDTSPDEELLTAAERGELVTEGGLEKQVARMLKSPRLESGARAFFADMLGFDQFDTLEKDAVIYPAFTETVARDAKEQALRTIVGFLLDDNGDYRDLFTVRKTVLTRPLGMLYHAAVEDSAGWSDHEFPAGGPHAGLLTQLSFLALHSHPGKSSPTLRGRAIRELLLCQKIPEPPANVSFDGFNDPNSPNKTARQRLTAHATDASCSGCHRLMDPIGLAMETFDGAGQTRAAENGEAIDPSGEMDGRPFTDAVSLGQVLRDDPALTTCLATRLYGYAAHRPLSTDERPWMEYLQKNFAKNGYRYRALVAQIAGNPAFYAVMPDAVSKTERQEKSP